MVNESSTNAQRPPLRSAALAAVFLLLVAAELTLGLSYVGSLRERARSRILEQADRRHSELARDIRALLGAGREHVSYLSKAPLVRSLVEKTGGAEIEQRLQAQLLPYLVSFRSVDAVSVIDGARGVELLRSERIGAGVGVLSGEHLGRAGEESSALAFWRSLLRLPQRGEIVSSGFVRDMRRVEVPEDRRTVLHFAAVVEAGEGFVAGGLVATLYAAPLLETVSRWAPVDGATARLVDAAGSPLDAGSNGGARAVDGPDAATFAAAGTARLETDSGFHFLRRVSDSPDWHLAATVPAAALANAVRDDESRARWIALSTTATAAVLLGVAVAFIRLNVRAFRLREERRFLAKIESESAKYRALLEEAPDVVLIVDGADGRIREWNAAARTLTGLAEPPARIDDIVVESDRLFVRDAVSEALRSGRAAIPAVRLRGAAGREVYADGRSARVSYADETVIQTTFRDLSRQRQMEEQMRVAERLGSLGLLTAGVAHEINNPLEGIGNYLALLERDPADPERKRRYLELVRHGFQRIRDIVRDLSTFARTGPSAGIADLVPVIEKARQLTSYDKSAKEVTFELRGFETPATVVGESGRLEQVFLTLFLNAAQAMSGGGAIAVTVDRETDAAGLPRIRVTVEDTGPGIPTTHLSRIFDPFFSTKETSGLGLSICYRIVQDHRGSLTAENRAEGGARFVLSLPAAAADRGKR